MTRISSIPSKRALARQCCVVAVLGLALGAPIAQADKNSGGKMLERLDSDNSGGISLSEFVAKVDMKSANRFAKRDKNGDGFITIDERKPAKGNGDKRAAMRECMDAALGADGARPNRNEMFAKMDASGDGAVDLDEFSAFAMSRATEKFVKIDADASGEATLDEIKSMRDARKGRKGDRKAAKKACRDQIQGA